MKKKHGKNKQAKTKKEKTYRSVQHKTQKGGGGQNKKVQAEKVDNDVKKKKSTGVNIRKRKLFHNSKKNQRRLGTGGSGSRRAMPANQKKKRGGMNGCWVLKMPAPGN